MQIGFGIHDLAKDQLGSECVGAVVEPDMLGADAQDDLPLQVFAEIHTVRESAAFAMQRSGVRLAHVDSSFPRPGK